MYTQTTPGHFERQNFDLKSLDLFLTKVKWIGMSEVSVRRVDEKMTFATFEVVTYTHTHVSRDKQHTTIHQTNTSQTPTLVNMNQVEFSKQTPPSLVRVSFARCLSRSSEFISDPWNRLEAIKSLARIKTGC